LPQGQGQGPDGRGPVALARSHLPCALPAATAGLQVGWLPARGLTIESRMAAHPRCHRKALANRRAVAARYRRRPVVPLRRAALLRKAALLQWAGPAQMVSRTASPVPGQDRQMRAGAKERDFVLACYYRVCRS
jgi:hypothetical protein